MSKINNNRQSFNLTITFKFYTYDALKQSTVNWARENDPEIKILKEEKINFTLATNET
jgi:uncharacterized protein YcfL